MHRSQRDQRVDQLVDRRLALLGRAPNAPRGPTRGAAARSTPRVADPEPVVGRLAVDQKRAIRAASRSRSPRHRCRALRRRRTAARRAARRARAAARPPRPARPGSPSRRTRRGRRAARLDVARKERRHAVEVRREHDRGRIERGEHVEPPAGDRLLDDGVAERPELAASHAPASASRPVVESMSMSAAQSDASKLDFIVLSSVGSALDIDRSSSAVRASVRSSRYFDDDRRRDRQAPLAAAAARHRARARHDDRAFGNDQRPARTRLDDPTVRQIVDRRGRR